MLPGISARNHNLHLMARRLSPTRSALSEAELSKVESRVMKYLATHESIANRDIRELADITYDQAGEFLRTMNERGTLRRIGAHSQTRYTLPE